MATLKYRRSAYGGFKIETVRLVRETPSFYVLLVENRGYRGETKAVERRSDKRTVGLLYDTWAEAHAALVLAAENGLAAREEAVVNARKALDVVKMMKEPAP